MQLRSTRPLQCARSEGDVPGRRRRSRERASRRLMPVLVNAVGAGGVAVALALIGHTIAEDVQQDRARWLIVDRDSGYTIAIDTSLYD